MALPALEDFSGSAANLPNPPWTTPSGKSAVRRDGSGLGGTSVNGVDCFAIWNADVCPNDQSVTLTVEETLDGTESNYIYIILRSSFPGGVPSYYIFWCDGGSDCGIYKVVSGSSETSIQDADSTTAVIGDIFKAKVVGTAIVITKNGTAFITTTDAAIAAGQFGHGGFSSGGVKFDNFVGADESGGGGSTPVGADAREYYEALLGG